MNSEDSFKRETQIIADQLMQEHVRETRALYDDNIRIRQELGRVVDMMNNFLTREKQLHDMLGSLTDSHTSIARDLHGKVQEAVGHGHRMAGDTKNKAGELMNLHTATLQELGRIQQILGSPAARPGMPMSMQPMQPMSMQSMPAPSSPLPTVPSVYSPPPTYQPASPSAMFPPAHAMQVPPPHAMQGGPMIAPAPMAAPPGYAASMVYGEDRNRNGIPDILEAVPGGMRFQQAPMVPGHATPPAVFRMLS